MKKLYVYLPFVLFLLLSNIYLLQQYLILKSTKEYKNRLEVNNAVLNNEIATNLHLRISNSDIQLDENLTLFDISENKYTLKNIIGNKTKLLLCSKESGCNLCIERELQLIKKYSDEVGVNNIVLLTNYNNSRKLAIFKKKNNFDFEVYSCPKLGVPIETERDSPFLFIIDSTLQVKHFFSPNRDLPEYSKKYYEEVIERYF